MAVVVFLSSMAEVLFVAHWSMLNWRVWQYKMNGKVWSFTVSYTHLTLSSAASDVYKRQGLVIYGAVRQVDDLEELDIGIQAMAAIPVGAAGEGIGESDVRVNFGGVTFFSGDHLYADNTGIILSEDPLDIE